MKLFWTTTNNVVLGNQVAGEAAGILDKDDTNAIAFDTVEETCLGRRTAWPCLVVPNPVERALCSSLFQARSMVASRSRIVFMAPLL